jgi:hypothetical protein
LDTLELENDNFLEMLLEYIIENFDELKLTWAVTLMKTLGTMTLGNQELLLSTMTHLSQPLHKKLKAAYDTSTKTPIMIEDIPDFTDYHSLWLTLQLFAAKRTRVNLNPEVRASNLLEESAQAIRLIANDLVKLFYGNKRWQATEMNIDEAAIVCSGLALVRLDNEKFISDLGDIIRHKIAHAQGTDFILLAKGSHYMRNYKHTKDIYAMVHANAMTHLSERKLEPEVIQALEAIYSQH